MVGGLGHSMHYLGTSILLVHYNSCNNPGLSILFLNGLDITHVVFYHGTGYINQ